MSKLAIRFGISGVALAKRCRKLEIPVPGVGYWARIAAGQKPTRKKLPKASPGASVEILFGTPIRAGTIDAPLVPEVAVAEHLAGPHAAVSWLAEAFCQATPDEHGRLRVGLSFHPDVCARKATIDRTLRILDALFKALEARGHRVEAQRPSSQYGPERELIVTALGQPFTLQVEEKLRRKPHVPTDEERREQAKAHWYQLRKWDHVPEGDILIRLFRGGSYQYTGRTTWSDTKVTTLDSQLGRAVLDIERVAEFMRALREEEEARKRVRLENERRERRSERLDWWRSRLADDLECMARDWRRAVRIREFLEVYTASTRPEDRPEFAAPWLEAARRYVQKLDPLSTMEGIPKNLEPSDEFLEQEIAAAHADRKTEGRAADEQRNR